MLGRDANDFRNIREIIKLIEQSFELSRGRNPEQRPRGLLRFVEIAMRDAARQPDQITGAGLDPDAVQIEVQHAVLDQDELVLGRMDMNRDKLAGIAVGLKGEG